MLIYLPAARVDGPDRPCRVTSAGLLGDYNGNGTVDAADYVVWRKADGTQAGYNTWRSHFGQIAASGSDKGVSSAAVPEPTSVALCLFAAIGWFVIPRSQKVAKNRC